MRHLSRTHLLMQVIAVAIAAASLLIAPAIGSAAPAIMPVSTDVATCYTFNGIDCMSTSDRYPTYKGWAHVNGVACIAMVGASCPTTFDAWRWTSTGWVKTSLAFTYPRIYVWPYASGWSWVWTSSTGWVATRSTHVMITYTCTRATARNAFDPTVCRVT